MIDNKFQEYNALDSACTLEIWNAIRGEIEPGGFMPAYSLTMSLLPVLSFVQTKGLRVDLTSLEETKQRTDAEAATKQEELNQLCGRELNVNSSKQCQQYFYIDKGIPPFTKDGAITCDDKALQRIAVGTARRAGLKEAKLVQEIRGLQKLSSTYYDIRFDEDSRFRSSYNPRGSKFGRLSSSQTIFGTGGNAQNLPQEFKRFLVADPGYFLWEVDKRQAEWVVVAYLTGDANMLSVVESQEDSHVHTASLMFNLPKELIIYENKLVGNYSDPDIIAELRSADPATRDYVAQLPRTMSARQCGKKCHPGSAEVLTPLGWLRMDKWAGQELMQWDRYKLSFTPADMNSYEGGSDMLHFQANHIDQLVTPAHRMVTCSDRSGEVEVVLAKELTQRSHWHMPTSGLWESEGNEHGLNVDELRLLACLQADGSIDTYGNVRLRFSKERKLERAQKLLDALELRYTRTTRGFFVHNSNEVIYKLVGLLGKEKNFGPYLLNSSAEDLREFIWETTHWDGYTLKGQYFTTNKNNAEWVQTIAHITGNRCTVHCRSPSKQGFGKKDLYWCMLSSRSRTSLVSITKTEEYYSDTVYCPTVPLGAFLVRYNGKISVSGNSNHGLNYDEGPNTFALTYELQLAESKRIIDLYHRIYPGIRIWYDYIKRQLQRDRSLTNCFGRKVRFMDAWGDTLWKAAYSMLPQSSVVDCLNIGMVKCYNNEWLCDIHGFNADILAQVHDSILFQVPFSSAPLFAQAQALVYDYVSSELEYSQRKFTIATDCKVGLNWGGYHREHNSLGMQELKQPSDLQKMLEAWQCQSET